MSVERAYARWAASYDSDRNLTRDLDQRATRQCFVGRRFKLALEAGCGTGKNTPFLASLADRLIAMDLSEAMLARARARAGCEGVRFERQDVVDRWPVADGSADLVAFNLVLEHIESLELPLRRAAEACAPGATLFVSELHPARQYAGSQARFTADGGGEERITAHVHHVTDFLQAAQQAGFALQVLREWWHDEDARQGAPRLLTLQFARA